MARERKFSGKVFKSGPFAMTYGNAQSEAKKLRSQGFAVRIVSAPKSINKSGKWFSIFRRAK